VIDLWFAGAIAGAGWGVFVGFLLGVAWLWRRLRELGAFDDNSSR
jgi:hypothetical protein